jgi:hypothetical protein
MRLRGCVDSDGSESAAFLRRLQDFAEQTTINVFVETLGSSCDVHVESVFDLVPPDVFDRVLELMYTGMVKDVENEHFRAGFIAEAIAEYIQELVGRESFLLTEGGMRICSLLSDPKVVAELNAASPRGKGRLLTYLIESNFAKLLNHRGLAHAIVNNFFLHYEVSDVLRLMECPNDFIASLTEIFLEIQALFCRTAMKHYTTSSDSSIRENPTRYNLIRYFRCFTMDLNNVSIDIHDGLKDPTYWKSSFRVLLVDNFGHLLFFLRSVERMVEYMQAKRETPIVAVDFEGLSEFGAPCLAQFAISNDPCTAFVVDVFKLGKDVFTFKTGKGTSIHSILQSPVIGKIVFDPVVDADALAYLFGVQPRGVNYLQHAELADREEVLLDKVMVSARFRDAEKSSAKKIDNLGKNMASPSCGGNHIVFQERPLHPIIVSYVAAQVTWILKLYEEHEIFQPAAPLQQASVTAAPPAASLLVPRRGQRDFGSNGENPKGLGQRDFGSNGDNPKALVQRDSGSSGENPKVPVPIPVPAAMVAFSVSMNRVTGVVNDVLMKILHIGGDECASAIVDLMNQFHKEQMVHFIKNPGRLEVEDLFRAVTAELVAKYIQSRVQLCSTLAEVAVDQPGESGESRQLLTEALRRSAETKEDLTARFSELLSTQVNGLIHDRGVAHACAKYLLKKNDILGRMDCPKEFMEDLIKALLQLQACATRTAIKYYSKSNSMTQPDAHHHLFEYFRCFSVNLVDVSIDSRDGLLDPAFARSSFRIILVDDNGYLLHFLRQAEEMAEEAEAMGATPLLTVHCEGVNLNRRQLCVVQFVIGNDPSTVYVVDVHKLGNNAFTFTTKKGTSIRSILQDQSVRKISFDPRNDVAALAHLIDIDLKGILDLHRALAAERQFRGDAAAASSPEILLQQCLRDCAVLSDEVKTFLQRSGRDAEKIYAKVGYRKTEILRVRPIGPNVLMNLAAQARWMQGLYETVVTKLSASPSLLEEIMDSSVCRSSWSQEGQSQQAPRAMRAAPFVGRNSQAYYC